MITKLAVLSLKEESGEGTLTTPTVTDCLVVEDLDVKTSFDPDAVNAYSASLSKYEDIAGNESITITGKVFVKGSGYTGTGAYTEPNYGPLLRACGAHITASTSAPTGAASAMDIMPAPDPNAKSYSALVNINGKQYLAAGVRGDGGLEMVVGRGIRFAFTLQGALYSITGAAILTPSGLNTTIPPVFHKGSTAFTYDNYEALISRLTLNLGNKVEPNTSPNATYGIVSYVITDRDARGEMDAREVATATYNIHSQTRANDKNVLTFKIGSARGNYVEFYGPSVQLTDYSPGDRNGLLVANTPLKYCRSTGNDEWRIRLS